MQSELDYIGFLLTLLPILPFYCYIIDYMVNNKKFANDEFSVEQLIHRYKKSVSSIGLLF